MDSSRTSSTVEITIVKILKGKKRHWLKLVTVFEGENDKMILLA